MNKIPDRLNLYCRPKEFITISDGTKIEVNPAYVADATNVKTNETGGEWCKGSYRTKLAGEVIKDVGNIGFSPSIHSLEYRGEGGRAYKVSIPVEGVPSGRIYVDLREDVLMDTLLNIGIKPGGILPGNYFFGVVGSAMKLIRESSSIHKTLIARDESNARAIIPFSKMIVGNKYGTPAMIEQNSYVTYLGLFEHEDIICDRVDSDNNTITYKPREKSTKNRLHLFAEEYYFRSRKANPPYLYCYIKSLKSSSYKIDLGLDADYEPLTDTAFLTKGSLTEFIASHTERLSHYYTERYHKTITFRKSVTRVVPK